MWNWKYIGETARSTEAFFLEGVGSREQVNFIIFARSVLEGCWPCCIFFFIGDGELDRDRAPIIVALDKFWVDETWVIHFRGFLFFFPLGCWRLTSHADESLTNNKKILKILTYNISSHSLNLQITLDQHIFSFHKISINFFSELHLITRILCAAAVIEVFLLPDLNYTGLKL